MFSLCLSGFPPDTLASSRSPKACTPGCKWSAGVTVDGGLSVRCPVRNWGLEAATCLRPKTAGRSLVALCAVTNNGWRAECLKPE